jgi:hypothetical protein
VSSVKEDEVLNVSVLHLNLKTVEISEHFLTHTVRSRNSLLPGVLVRSPARSPHRAETSTREGTVTGAKAGAETARAPLTVGLAAISPLV